VLPISLNNVLIVDNDKEFRDSLTKILSKAGYHVVAAGDGKEASALVTKEKFPLIVLDLKMPGKSGFELLEEIKEKTPKSQVIIITAFGEENSYLEAKHGGAFEFLNKPVKRKEILESAKRALESLQIS
jgi:two-component system NtrC family response regulator